MYSDVFCKVYNEFGWNYYPEIFGEQLMKWMSVEGIQPKSALDLACGTGVLCERLLAAGMEVWGMDFSSGMIDIARHGSQQIHYDVADMITYRPDKKFNLVTCTGDAINHIHDLSNVEKIFQNVYDYLSDGGYFVFDILNENEVSTSEPFEMDYDSTTKVWFQMTKPEENQVNLKIRVYENEQFAFEENIHEKVHDPKAICDLLVRSGFTLIRCADSLMDDGSHGTTWFVIARKVSKV